MSGITDEEFWYQAEARVLDLLQIYARHAANGTGLQRQLFADDAARGFAFVDLCRQQFDVVLMNPLFGGASKPSKVYVEKAYPRTKNEMCMQHLSSEACNWSMPAACSAPLPHARDSFSLRSRSDVRKSY